MRRAWLTLAQHHPLAVVLAAVKAPGALDGKRRSADVKAQRGARGRGRDHHVSIAIAAMTRKSLVEGLRKRRAMRLVGEALFMKGKVLPELAWVQPSMPDVLATLGCEAGTRCSIFLATTV